MAIGLHIKKYQEQKAAEAAEKDTVQDPKTYMTKPESEEDDAPTQSNVLAQIAQMQMETARLIADMRASMANGGSSDGSLTVIEKMLEQQERLVNKTIPENRVHPGMSVYSYPEGDTAASAAGRIKELRCKMTWVGYDLVTDTLTPLETELLNQVQPGEFRVTKADGTRIPFRVTAKHSDQYDDSTGRFKTDRLDLWFPCKGEHKQNHMSMVAYLQQVLHGSIPTAEELLKEVARLKAELASAKAGLVGAVA